MNKALQKYADRFDAQTLRERGIIAGSLLIAICFVWWSYYAEPAMARIQTLQTENTRISGEINNTRAIIADIRRRIQTGVHQDQEIQLANLREELEAVEERLRLETIELVDPEKMFQLMNQLLYRDSQLKLLSLKRREVKPAFPVDEEDGESPGIYRHVLEIEFAGKYLDILDYMQSLERLDWKLLWDEIEISTSEYPKVTVKVAISTLSTRKEWVGI